MSVQGKIVGVDAHTACRLQLDGGKREGTRQLTIAAEFNEPLLVAPGVHEYYVEISCEGHTGKFRGGTYRLGGGTRALDLGTIVLKVQ